MYAKNINSHAINQTVDNPIFTPDEFSQNGTIELRNNSTGLRM